MSSCEKTKDWLMGMYASEIVKKWTCEAAGDTKGAAKHAEAAKSLRWAIDYVEGQGKNDEKRCKGDYA